MSAATNINEVIIHLDHIIDWSKENKSRIGYFATLYRKMTVAVQQGIQQNGFANNERMEELDVIFANRYINAWKAYTNKQKCTNAWCAAFDAADTSNLIVLQHLILGINTHINLDLGIAASETSPGDEIFDLERDFVKINDIIEALVDSVQHTLSRVWFPLKLLTQISNNREEPVINFSIAAARKASWANAVALALASEEAKDNYINMMDNTVVKLAARISKPGWAVNLILKPVLVMEDKDVRKVIDLLHD